MSVISHQSLIEQLKWRYAVKAFDSQKTIAPDVWKALEESLVLTPSSFGMQPWKFFVITDKPIREKLLTVSWNQRQVVDCSHHVVFTIKKDVSASDAEHFLKRMVEVRGGSLEMLDPYKKKLVGFLSQPKDKFNVDEWATRQVYIALGNFMTSAAMLGVDTCPMEGIDPKQYDQILGLSQKGYATVVACAAGYRSVADKYASMLKVRYEHEQMVERL